MMKNCIRIFIAAVLLALPVVFTACSSDDGPRVPKGPEAFEYQWELAGTVIAQGTAAEKRAALDAEEEINAILVASFRAKTIEGATVSVDSVKQIFKVVGSDADSNDDVVRGVYYSAKADLKKAAAKGLPTQATITIKRDNYKTIIDKEKLRD